jgi:hypothetical protein
VRENWHSKYEGVGFGEFELALVAVKPGHKYRKRGIVGDLVEACEGEISRGWGLCLNPRVGERAEVRVMLVIYGNVVS